MRLLPGSLSTTKFTVHDSKEHHSLLLHELVRPGRVEPPRERVVRGREGPRVADQLSRFHTDMTSTKFADILTHPPCHICFPYPLQPL